MVEEIFRKAGGLTGLFASLLIEREGCRRPDRR